MIRFLIFLAVAFSAVGCTSTKPLEPRPLPFHVAVAPIHQVNIGTASPGELPGEATQLALELSPAELTDAVCEALHEFCFTEVTVLDPEGLDETVDDFARQELLLQQARLENADLIVALDLRYDTEIYRKNSRTFWLNYPLFLLAGPSNWFVGDNRYYADVELSTSIYDLAGLDAGGFAIGDSAARVVTASSRYSGSELDFVDRADGVGDYAKGIFIPSGFLARESEEASELIHEQVVDELRRQVVQDIQSRRSELVRAEWVAPLFLEPEDVTWTREGEALRVRGVVRLRRGSLAGRVEAVRLSLGGVEREAELGSVASEEAGYELVGFEGVVPSSEGASCLRIECEAGTRDRYVRSYTFEVR